MGYILIAESDVVYIHDNVLNPGELPGLALDKSLGGALSRVEFRLSYGLIGDVYDLAASYAVVIATGHTFNDGNKRTAFRVMEVCLVLNDISIEWDVVAVGNMIIEVAQSHVDEAELARWLRSHK